MEIRTKYNINNKVWTVDGKHAVCFTIRGINVHKEYDDATLSVIDVTQYKGKTVDWTDERDCYSTHEEVRNSI